MRSSSASRCSPARRRKRTTTPPSSGAFQLPNCAEFTDDVVSDDLLDLVDSQALVRALAEQGIEGAYGLLQRSSSADDRLAQRIAELRERLRRQASRSVGRVLEAYEQRAVELELVGRREEEQIAARLAELEARLKAARRLDLSRIGDSGLLGEVQAALLLPDAPWRQAPAREGVLARLRAFFARILEFFRRLFGRSKRARRAPARKERSLTFATLAQGGRVLGASELGDALAQLSRDEQRELTEQVARTIEAKERGLEREAEAKRREAEAQRRRLEAEREEAKRRAEHEAEDRVKEAERHRLNRELKERGLVAEHDGQLTVTYGLVERFARIVLEEESQRLPSSVRLSFKGVASTGIYEKARLRQPDEVAHLDLPSSLLAARLQGLRHIDEASSYVYREVTSESVHVVLAFDKSGSMAEAGKLPAAKKALLALYIAIRRRHPDATLDVLAFENQVRLLDLLELWECTPGSFTNTAEALHTAHLLLRSSKATRKEVFLITDGLPEAYTDVDGRVRSGQLDRAMDHALARAVELSTVVPLRFSMVLLKSDHPEYELAARRITRTLSGDLIVTDPQHLGVELLVKWAGGTETTRRASPGARADGDGRTAGWGASSTPVAGAAWVFIRGLGGFPPGPWTRRASRLGCASTWRRWDGRPR